MSEAETYVHRRLSCGIEYAALPLAGRRTVAIDIRVLSGMADEPADRLGLAHLVNETIDKGTQKRSGQELTDAFDAIGAQRSSFVGREATVFRCNCLPEFAEQALLLHVEMLRTPTFSEEACGVAIELAGQELKALEDEPDELSRRLMARRAYGTVLGRHALGERETLGRIGRSDIAEHWRSQFAAARMVVTVGGAVDADGMAAAIDERFAGFGDGSSDGRGAFAVSGSPGRWHHDKELEQEYILMCWAGVPMTHDDQPIENVALSVLGGGMSSRLFTEVREKQGLVYWVGAWSEHPRGAGMVFMGASTTPERCDQTYATLLREVDRMADDLTEDELERAKVGITAKQQTHGDLTTARVGELSADLFHFGRPVRHAEKTERVLAVTTKDVKRYLKEHPRDQLCVVTLGPRALANGD